MAEMKEPWDWWEVLLCAVPLAIVATVILVGPAIWAMWHFDREHFDEFFRRRNHRG